MQRIFHFFLRLHHPGPLVPKLKNLELEPPVGLINITRVRHRGDGPDLQAEIESMWNHPQCIIRGPGKREAVL